MPANDIWTLLGLLACVGPFIALAVVVAVKPFISRVVPWWQDGQADEMRRLGITPDDSRGVVDPDEISWLRSHRS